VGDIKRGRVGESAYETLARGELLPLEHDSLEIGSISNIDDFARLRDSSSCGVSQEDQLENAVALFDDFFKTRGVTRGIEGLDHIGYR